jgi:hypothetical protein
MEFENVTAGDVLLNQNESYIKALAEGKRVFT